MALCQSLISHTACISCMMPLSVAMTLAERNATWSEGHGGEVSPCSSINPQGFSQAQYTKKLSLWALVKQV